MNILKRIEKVENQLTPKDNRIWVTVYGEDGRVIHGSKELIGLTHEEVTAYTGDGTVIRVVRASQDEGEVIA